MPECAKTRLQQSRISKFSGGGPPAPSLQGEGRGREGGDGGEKEGGKDREGREGTEEGRNGGGEETGGALDMGSAPLETSSGSAPVLCFNGVIG